MSAQGIDQLLGQLRAASALAAGGETQAPAGSAPDFGEMLKASIDQVNNAQQEADKLAQAFSQGAPDANLHEVMLSLQKANITFQTMVQVRNKLVTAYQEIMNMQV